MVLLCVLHSPYLKLHHMSRKYLEGLEEVNGTLSTDLFLRLLRKAYSDAYYGAIHMEFMRDIKDVEYPLEIHIDDTPKLEKLGLLGDD